MEVPKCWILFLINLSGICTGIQERNISRDHQEGLDLRNTRHYREASKSEAKLTSGLHDAFILNLPKFTDCKDLKPFKYAMKAFDPKKNESDKNIPVTTGTVSVCSHLGGNLFYFGSIPGDTHREIIIFPTRKDASQPFAVVYGNLPEKGKKEAQKIAWHVVAGTGPGWIDLRFKFKDSDEYMTLWIHYRRRAFNTLNQLSKENMTGTRINQYVNSAYGQFTVMPVLPCPDWREKGIYCVLLTDIVQPIAESVERYSDYELAVYATDVKESGGGDHQRQAKDDKVQDNSSMTSVGEDEVYRCVVRVWYNCDPTTNCRDYMTPLYTITGSGPPPSQPPHGWTLAMETVTPVQFGEPDSIRFNPRKIPPKAVTTLRKLWPLFLALLLIILLVLVPWFFFFIRRRAMEERMKSWYTGTSPTGLVDYAMALPVHVRVPSGNVRKRRGGNKPASGRSRSSAR